ncbi:Two-pore potassium channel [Thalictrum thalictroides]|uniref:Two-pore potassium channel n=1 Tax=Thalictrum thalictroides TaxID=46969 RepID=A0A7J6XB81_THATH|nr:Two-pore potassium channel [Thalictrum thalictroides]
MASADANEPLLTRSVNPPCNKNDLKRRKLCHSRSAPIDFVPLEKKEAGLIQRSNSIFGTLNLGFGSVILLLVIYLGVGCICFYLVKDQIRGIRTNRLLDALYFCVVTMTTVGYGDLVPDSVASKLLACVFVFTGMALVGIILSKSADYFIEKQEVMLVKALHIRQKVGELEIIKDIQSNKVRYKFLCASILLVILITVGTVFLIKVEKLSIVDAIYCVCSTITTLGYGDKSFSTEAGRIFAVIWILTSTVCLAQFFLYLAELNTERRQQYLVKWVLSRRMTAADLEAADLDDDGTVVAAEFVIYKLKEMGKITQEDISLVMEEFEALDVDQSGTLSASDLMLAHCSQT